MIRISIKYQHKLKFRTNGDKFKIKYLKNYN